MFKNLTNYSYQRTKKEAVGFYVAYLILIILLGTLLSAIVGLILGQNSFSLGVKIGTLTALTVSMGLSFTIIKRKNIMNNFGLIILALLSGVLALFGGALLGLIPTAYLSTKSPSKR